MVSKNITGGLANKILAEHSVRRLEELSIRDTAEDVIEIVLRPWTQRDFYYSYVVRYDPRTLQLMQPDGTIKTLHRNTKGQELKKISNCKSSAEGRNCIFETLFNHIRCFTEWL